ncbi:MAG: peptidoglycan DD-metalloendopeptidase family protein [Bacteroidota bacterium]
MARIKYYYDTETCRYERAKVTKSDILINLMGFLTVALIMALALVFIYNTYFETPVEKALKKENKELLEHYNVLENEMTEVQEVITALEERDNNIYRKIYEAEPLPLEIRQAGIGGTERYKAILEKGLADKALVISTAQKIDLLKRKASIQNQSFDKLMQLARDKGTLNTIPAIQPVKNPELTKLVSGFGMRINPFHKARVMHEGLDFAAPRNTPVYATADGKVITAKENKVIEAGYGSYVQIDHGNGYETKYAHLGSLSVEKGDEVKRGDIVGYVGSTGGSVAPHVHYEVILDGNKIDPVNFLMYGLNDAEYKKLLKLSMRENQSFD